MLQSYPPSVFYAANKISKNLLKKQKLPHMIKINFFCNLYEQLENKDLNKNKNLLLATPFIEKRSNTDLQFIVLVNCLKCFKQILLT